MRNALSTRAAFLQKLIDPRKDIEAECGHPFSISREDYKQSFLRGDLAARVVAVYPEETWVTDPQIYEKEDEEETPFEAAFNLLQKEFHLFSILQRADLLSGIGRFGAILLGIDDGLALNQPVANIDETGEKTGNAEHKLIYIRAFDETNLIVQKIESDQKNPRYGLPVEYQINFLESALGIVGASNTVTVHWTRVLHICDNRCSSEIFGLPRMEKVFNRLLDLKKIMGGSGEMFWKGGFPGYSLEATPSVDGTAFEFDAKATKEQMEDYMNGLSRYIATIGMSVKSLNPQVADPTQHMEAQIRLIAMAMSVPWRILMGVEVGQLASEQDIKAWNRRISRRQSDYVEPFIIRQLIDRLMDFGVLPELQEEDYIVEWEDLNTPSDKEKATVALNQTQAMAAYVQGGVDAMLPPFFFFTLVLRMTDQQALAVIEASEEQLSETDPTPLHPHGPEPDPNQPQVDAQGNPIQQSAVAPKKQLPPGKLKPTTKVKAKGA